MDAETKLTAKQKRFVEEYLIDLNGTQAAIRAGYSPNSANEIASENLAKPNVAAYLDQRQQEIATRLELSQEWVLNRFKQLSDRCMQAEPVMIPDGSGGWMESGEYKFDSSGAYKATEAIGKHLGFFEEDNKQKTQTNEIDLSKLSDEAVKSILNAGK